MTKTQYQHKLDIVCEHLPSHPLLSQLKEGYSTINALYLDNIFNNLEIKPSFDDAFDAAFDVATSIRQNKSIDTAIDVAIDDIFKAMLSKKYSLKSQLRAASNRFHQCQSNAERREVSIQVNELFDELRALQKEIDYYEEYGKLPPSVQNENKDDFFKMPTTEVDVKKAINTAHSTISQLQKDILKFSFEVKNDPKHIFHNTWRNLEKRLQKWQKRLILLKKEREIYKNML